MTLKAKLIILITVSFSYLSFRAQPYAPPAGQAGTSALYKDSSVFIAWATAGKITRGYQDISNPGLGFASAGDSTMVTGKAQSNGVVSLGDGGAAICTFAKPIMDGPGYDFVVFENSFDDTFLELAFVEVSSDGIHFVRFLAHSLTDTVTQTTSFGLTDATKLNNLAGKYRGGYGTPFDLQELAGNNNLNINAITHVKIIDVVGSINSLYATHDSYGNKVNDPWPTAFPSGGFDLDAVGVIHENQITGITENSLNDRVSVFPNPVANGNTLKIKTDLPLNEVTVTDVYGRKLLTSLQKELDVSALSPGIYLVNVVTEKGTALKKISVE